MTGQTLPTEGPDPDFRIRRKFVLMAVLLTLSAAFPLCILYRGAASMTIRICVGVAAALLWGLGLQACAALYRALMRTVCTLGEIADGDLLAADRLERRDDFGSVCLRMTAALRRPMTQVAAGARRLVQSAEELQTMGREIISGAEVTSNQATMVSDAADQVSQSVQTVAAGTKEMSGSIGEIARNAAEAAQVARAAVDMANATEQTISKLNDASAQIGKVIKVIHSIAEQTNLLALNATIEAARAGEAGKGFAVVANEVKELAKGTAKATEEVGQQIAAIQNETKNSVAAISNIGRIINQISDLQNSIASAVEEQTATTREMGRSVGQAATGTSDIAQAIASVAKAANATLGAAAGSQKVAAGLVHTAADLQSGLRGFEIPKN